MDEFQKHAEEMTKMLKDKTAKKREKAQARQRELKNRSNAQMAFGKKASALAAKFAYKLKEASIERKSQNEKDSSENFVIEQMKQSEFNKAIKHIEVVTKMKPKREGAELSAKHQYLRGAL